jgi:hypothetical protein
MKPPFCELSATCRSQKIIGTAIGETDGKVGGKQWQLTRNFSGGRLKVLRRSNLHGLAFLCGFTCLRQVS